MKVPAEINLTLRVHDREAEALVPDLVFWWQCSKKSKVHRKASAATREAIFENVNMGVESDKSCKGPVEMIDVFAGLSSDCPIAGTRLEVPKKSVTHTFYVPSAELMGHFPASGYLKPDGKTDFVKVEAWEDAHEYSEVPYLRREVLAAFRKMRKAADAAGHKIFIRSAARTFKKQKDIWEQKWNGDKMVTIKKLMPIKGQMKMQEVSVKLNEEFPEHRERALKVLEYSSMPGGSRHHWGTDFDLNNFTPDNWEKVPSLTKIWSWLDKNAASFGFAQPYTHGRPHGYNEEQWHWSYIPLAHKFLQRYVELVKDSDISCFEGSDQAASINFVRHYAEGIGEKCKSPLKSFVQS